MKCLNDFFPLVFFLKTGFFEYNISGVDEDSVLLGHDAALMRNRFPVFRNNAFISTSRAERYKKNAGDSWSSQRRLDESSLRARAQ